MLDFVNEQMMLSALIATIGKYFVALLSAKSAQRVLRYSVVGFNPAVSTLSQIVSAVAVSTFVAIGGLTIVRFGLYWWQRDTLYSSFYWYTDSTIPKVELAWFWQTGLSLYTSFIPIAFWALSVFVGRATLGRDVSFSKYNVYDAIFLGVSLVLYVPLVYFEDYVGLAGFVGVPILLILYANYRRTRLLETSFVLFKAFLLSIGAMKIFSSFSLLEIAVFETVFFILCAYYVVFSRRRIEDNDKLRVSKRAR